MQLYIPTVYMQLYIPNVYLQPHHRRTRVACNTGVLVAAISTGVHAIACSIGVLVAVCNSVHAVAYRIHGKMCSGGYYTLSYNLLLVARHILTMGLQKCP